MEVIADAKGDAGADFVKFLEEVLDLSDKAVRTSVIRCIVGASKDPLWK